MEQTRSTTVSATLSGKSISGAEVMPGPACIDCIFYVKPGFWKRLREGMFAARCSHPECRDEVDRAPLPCVTMRLVACERGRLFKPKQV
jgi:hypothetical protein